MRKPDFIIVGAPKCGTTAMASYLRQHPRFFLPHFEVHYFGDDISTILGGRRPDWFTERFTEEKYLELFAEAPDDVRVGEHSSMYFYSKTAAREIKAFAPDVKIILMLRCPPDLMYSMHSMLIRLNVETQTDFRASLEAVHAIGPDGDSEDAGVDGKRNFYLDVGRLAQHAGRFFDVFERENIHVILFDDLKKDTHAVYRDTVQFLGVDDDFEPELKRYNRAYSIRSRKLSGLLTNPPQSVRKVVKAVTPLGVRNAIRNTLNKVNVVPSAPKPLDPVLRRQLLGEFVPEIERLEQLIGRDLAHWRP